MEEQLRDVLKAVAKRSDSVRFSKDDFESLAEAQSQLDALFKETVTEILAMKQRLRSKFHRMQNRKPRNNKKDWAAIGEFFHHYDPKTLIQKIGNKSAKNIWRPLSLL